MNGPPICARCRHATGLWLAPAHQGPPRCDRLRGTGIVDPVDGQERFRRFDCGSERRGGRTLFGRPKCGPAGQFFEVAS